jgi:hypothetical protein
MKYLKLFENFQENKLPNSITIKLNGDKFLKWVLRKKDPQSRGFRDEIMQESDIIKSMNYELLKKDGLTLINGEYYPLFIYNPHEENPLCVYIMFNGENTQVDPNCTNFGACISIVVQTTLISSTEFSTFSGPLNKDLQKLLPVDQRIEKANGWNYYTNKFTPGTKFTHDYFELVSVNYI